LTDSTIATTELEIYAKIVEFSIPNYKPIVYFTLTQKYKNANLESADVIVISK